MKFFQTTLLIVFGGLAIISLIVFATYKGGSSVENAQITLWGTIPQGSFQKVLDIARTNGDKTLNIRYVQKDPATFDTDIVEALAIGAGPDAVILPNDLIVRMSDKIYPIPYTALSVTDYKNTFASISDIYLTPQGALALPISVDPMVMYWNRSIFNQTRKKVPTEWAQLLSIAPDISQKDKNNNIVTSAAGLGEYSNINNAKDILVTLMMQTGTSLVTYDGEKYDVSINNVMTAGQYSGSVAALRFYTDFANPVKTTYSWNRALPDDKTFFTSGNLALYFGFISEYNNLAQKNPNLDFDVTTIPQKTGVRTELTYGDLTGLAILKASANKQAAFNHLFRLVQQDTMLEWSKQTGRVPVRLDILLNKPIDPIQDLAYKCALLSKTWFDPQGSQTNLFVKDMVENVVTGRTGIEESVNRFSDQINLLLSKK
jgi:ABC-type glycerol-3-phosphate transport system substrate-binding protein